jgi:hypothetical protein
VGSQSAPIMTPPRPAFLNHLQRVIAAASSSVTPAPSYTSAPWCGTEQLDGVFRNSTAGEVSGPYPNHSVIDYDGIDQPAQ